MTDSANPGMRTGQFVCILSRSLPRKINRERGKYNDVAMREAVNKTTPDKSVLQRMAEGDRSAVKDCLDRYGKLIWSVVCRLCPQPGDREDAVQEIFVEIWRNAGRYRADVATEGTFIAMIARRRMIDRLRKFQRQPITCELDEVTEPGADNGSSGEHNAELVNVNQAMSGLTADQQKVIRMSVVQGYSHSEVAERTGIPIGTVKTHIRRGLMQVRERLQAHRTAAEDNGSDS